MRKQELQRDNWHGKNRTVQSIARQIDRETTSRAATETLRALIVVEARNELYGSPVGPPEWAKFAFRCYNCRNLIELCADVPFSPSGLSPRKCKVCGKLQPMIENRRRYDPKVILTIEQDLESLVQSKLAAGGTLDVASAGGSQVER